MRARSLSAIVALLFYLCPQVVRGTMERAERGWQHHRGNNAAQWHPVEWLLSIRDCISQILLLPLGLRSRLPSSLRARRRTTKKEGRDKWKGAGHRSEFPRRKGKERKGKGNVVTRVLNLTVFSQPLDFSTYFFQIPSRSLLFSYQNLFSSDE